MAQAERPDEEVAEELLALLREEVPEAPPDLPDRTIRKVQASLTARDLIDLTTVVFVLRFCAPILDLIAAMFGSVHSDEEGRHHHD
jgi:hypothetical protein